MDLNFYEKCIDQELSKIIKLGIEGLNFSYVSNLEKEVLSLKQREFTSKGQAYKFFEQLYKNSVYKLEEKLSEYDPLKISESLMLYLSPLTKLTIISKILYIGEYKNWQDVSFNFMNIFKEQQKIKKINQSHMNLLAILNLNLKKLFSMLKIHKVNGIEEVELKLINVFENRNISSNQNKDIKNFSRVEFEIYLQNNQSNFLKIKEK